MDIYKRKMSIKKNTNKTLKEVTSVNPLNPYFGEVDPTQLTRSSIAAGEKSAGSAQARAEFLKSKAQKNLSTLGIYGLEEFMSKKGIVTAEALKSYGKPFGFSFQIENGPKLSGTATYNKELSGEYGTIVLNFNKGIIIFDKKSILRPFMPVLAKFKKSALLRYKGDQAALAGLQVKGIFDVIIQGDISPEEEGQENQEGEENEGEEGQGGGKETEMTSNMWVNKGDLFMDLSKFFQFTHNNRKQIAPQTFNACRGLKVGMEVFYKGKNKQFVAVVKELDPSLPDEVTIQRKGNVGVAGKFSTVCTDIKPLKGVKTESFDFYLNQIAKNVTLITEEDEENPKEENAEPKENTDKIKGKQAKIKILKIDIDIKYSGSGKGESKGLSSSNFTKVKGDLIIPEAVSNQQSLFEINAIKQIVDLLRKGEMWVRLTNKPSKDFLIFSKKPDMSDDFFTLGKKGIKAPEDIGNWVGEIMVGDKAMNEVGKAFKAKLNSLSVVK